MAEGWRSEYKTFGEYLRSKNLRIEGCRSHIGRDRTSFKANQKELDLYADARKQGVAPAGTRTAQIREALDISDRIGRAYDAASDSKHVTE